jgi:HPt (histidine-containing phosphotransfer) domain-containing protein
MSLWHDVSNAGESAVQFLGQAATAASNELSSEAHTLLKAAASIGKAEVKFAAAAEQKLEHAADVVAHQTELFGEGVVTGAVLNPINGVDQLINHIAGTHLPPLEFSNQEEVNHSIAGKIGTFAGTAAQFILTDGALGAVSGIEAGSAAALAINGAIQGGILTPSDNTKTGGNFFVDRLENAAIDAASFAAMGGVAGKVADAFGDAGSGVLKNVIKNATSNAYGGLVGGLISAEGKALKDGKLATGKELLEQVGAGMAFGATFGAGMIGMKVAVDALRPPVQPGDPLIPRIPNSIENPQQLANLIDLRRPVSARFFDFVAKAVDKLPPSVRQLLEDKGAKIVLDHKLTDYDPSLSGVRPRGWKSGTFENCEGVFVGRTLGPDEAVVAEYRVSQATGKEVRTTREQEVVRHEVGHAVDKALGLPWRPFSQSPEFQTAYQSDLAQIPSSLKSRLDYYVQPSNPEGGASEAFAQLFAALHGGAGDASKTQMILQHFGRTAEVIKRAMAKLKDAGSVF